MRKIIQQIMALTALCWVMASCTDEAFNQEYGEGMGYLRLELGKVDVEVSSTTKADAGSLPKGLIPATTDFMINIKQGNKPVEGFPKKYSDLQEGIELEAGGYTVIAYYGENEPIQDTPYFSGSSNVEIYPGNSTSATINAALANAMVTPVVSESLQNHYSEWSLKLEAGELSIELANQDNKDGYLFAKAGQSVNAVFEGTNALRNPTSHEWTVISEAIAQTKYVIQCDPDLSVFSNIQLTATATHTYEEGSLTGTNVVLNLAANGAPLELVDGWDIQLLYKGSTIRTYSSLPQSDAIMAVVEKWPYVPHASTLAASIHLKTGEMINLTSVAIEEIPDPEFTVAVSGNTSYSVYQNSGAEEANKKDGSSIFDINATATIASEISGNPNYSDILKVSYETDSGKSSGELPFGTASELNSLAWQKHELTATVSFDGGKNTSSPIECDVTGLPYTLKHPANNYGWYTIDGNDIQYNDNSIHLETWSPAPIIGSPSFYIPETLAFSLDCEYEKNNGSIGSYTFSVEMLKSSDHSRSGEICSHKSNKKGRYNLSGNGSFTSEINAVSCRYDYKAHGNSVNVISMQINYQ